MEDIFSSLFFEIIGFLKKLPQFPMIFGSGSLLDLISLTKLEIS
jgi:hypothetical protein